MFDCGGQQLVYEQCIPSDSSGVRDIEVVEELIREIEERNLPAPGPIEQRWSARSQSYLR
jgi:L-galactono-1,4-lactone dehydrogenase